MARAKDTWWVLALLLSFPRQDPLCLSAQSGLPDLRPIGWVNVCGCSLHLQHTRTEFILTATVPDDLVSAFACVILVTCSVR